MDTDRPTDDPTDRGWTEHRASLVERRRALKLLGAAGAAGLLALAGCGDDGNGGEAASSARDSTTSGGSATTGGQGAGTTSTAASLGEIPEETAGPYPGDGSNGPDVLDDSGVVRGDIRSSYGDYSGTADGVPLTVELTVLDNANGNAPLAGAAVYLWHCDREGRYSLYSQGATDQNYLRGVQEAGSDGKVRFTTIYPGCYAGRWPHIHFEVFPDLDAARDVANRIATSQLAFPEDACAAVYATAGYETSVRNLSSLSLETDGIFRDGWDQQLATLTGSAEAGYVATLDVPVK